MKKHQILSAVLLVLALGSFEAQFAQDAPLDVSVVAPFMNQFATDAFALMVNNAKGVVADGKYTDREDVFVAIAAHREHFTPDSSAYVWMSRFTPANVDAPLGGGWKSAFVLVRATRDVNVYGQNGYIFAMYSTSQNIVLLKDESGRGYRSTLPETGFSLAGLHNASDFPGAAPCGPFGETDDGTVH